MRYRDLHIETQRQAPSNARTEGSSFLVRAGYLTRDGSPTALGHLALSRLQQRAGILADFSRQFDLPASETDTGEFFFEIRGGSSEVLHCNSCNYTGPRELARFKKQPMPDEPALPPEKISTPDCGTIEALARFLGTAKEKTAKALMYTRMSDGKFIFVVVRGDMQLSEPKLKKLVGDVRTATAGEIGLAGAAVGYASPIGLREALIVADDLIPHSVNLAAGANEGGYHLKNTNYGRDYSAQIVGDLALASAGDPCPNCGTAMVTFEAELLADESGPRLESILLALAEVHHDERGLTLPRYAAPFDIYLMHLSGKEMDTQASSEQLYADLQNLEISVLFDDRDERAGVKFNDADLIGCPLRITVGEKGLKEGMVELKPRQSKQSLLVPSANIIAKVQSSLQTQP